MDKISIIVPIYNGASTIEKCINSILNQTYKNFEILAINDGSIDDTLQLLYKLQKLDNRIKIFTKQNGGVSSARNLGLDKATGDYIEFMDCDDELKPEMFEKLLNAIKTANADLAICNFENNPMFKSYLTNKVYDLKNEYDAIRIYQETFGITTPWNKLFKKETIKNLRFNESISFTEDEIFNLASFKYIKKIVTISDSLYIYNFGNQFDNNSSSCIEKIVGANSFWKDKKTIWHLTEIYTVTRKKVISDALKEGYLYVESPDELAYYRMFDFLLWGLVSYTYLKTSKEGLIEVVKSILFEPPFIKSVEVQNKFGVSLKPFDNHTNDKIENFIDLLIKTNNDNITDKEFKMIYAFYMIFTNLFLNINESLDTHNVNLVVKIYKEFEKNTSKEAKYVNKILK